jgi:protein-S-isoprenylcysteine O-methyltransferase Ste14
MEWVALALFALYGLVGIGIRIWVQVRRTGDTGFRGLSGTPGSIEWLAGVLFVVAVVAGVTAPVAGLLGLGQVPGLDRTWLQMVGVVLAVLGIAGTFVTQLAMGRSWRIGVDETERTDLVDTGPFAIVRNPIYTAVLITIGGIALVVPNVIALLGWCLLVLAIELQVRAVEEPYLHRLHGETFERYVATVGRFIPLVGRGGERSSPPALR